MTADYPKPREVAWCETYALKPQGEKSLYGDINFRDEWWRVKRSPVPGGWHGPVLLKYEAEAGYDVIAHFASFALLDEFMEKHELIVF